MPLHDYIKTIYEDMIDTNYVTRFLSYLINIRYNRVTFSVNGITSEPLITGVLEESKTKRRFNSIAEFYTYASGVKVKQTDLSVLSKVFVTREYSVMRIICNAKEADILNFFDQKYRAFLMYRDVRKRIKLYADISTNNSVNLIWDSNEFELSHGRIICKDNPKKEYKLLEAYESSFIEGLYFCQGGSQYLITDS